MNLRTWLPRNMPLSGGIAIISAVTSCVAGIIALAFHIVASERVDWIDPVGIVLITITGIAFTVYTRLSLNRLRADIAQREQVERVLRESEAKYRDLVENAPLGIVISSFDGHVLEVNDALVGMHGYESREEFARSAVADRFWDLKDRERWVAKVWDTGGTEAAELRTKRKDGSPFWSYLISRPRTTETGEQQLLTMVQDITKRRNAEDALMFKTTLLEAQTEATQEGILVSDDEGKIVLSNSRFREMWQIPQGWIETRDNGDLLRFTAAQVTDPGSFSQRVRYLSSHREEKGEDTIETIDGRVIHRYTAPLVDAGGAYRGRIWYFRDITEPRKIRERLERAGAEWNRTFDSIADAISIQDKDFRLVRVNKAYADLFGKEPEELAGSVCFELVHGTTCPMTSCPHRRTLKTGKPEREECFEPRLGVYLEITTSPIFDEAGAVVGTVHVTRNVTKRREMEQQLLLADRLASIGQLVSGVAHELNNPLTTVIGFSELLIDREVPADIKQDLGLVHSEAQRAAAIVKNLLTFARKHDAVRQPARIEEIIDNVLRLRAYEEEVGGIRVVRRFAPDLPQIQIDSFQMQQVFFNLVVNAEFFMAEAHKKGVLTITADRADDMMRISFADDGPGISQDNLSRLFDPFFTTKEVGKGTGLGLSICHGIVMDHGGKIYATSEIGSGATFVVELPISGNSGKRELETDNGSLSEISGRTFGRSNPVNGTLGKVRGGVSL
jgi:PAS domain S-box-containing protein